MGRRKVPGALRLLNGAERSKVNQSAPAPRPNRPVMPRDMTVGAQRVWRHVMKEYGATGVIRAAHRDLLRAYCEASARMVEWGIELDAAGPLITTRGGLVKNPLHQMVRDATRQMIAAAIQLGLTPSAAENIHVGSDVAGSEDAASAWEAEYAGNRTG